MKNKLSCAQVIALFSFYIEDKLNSKLKASVDSHIKDCSACREFYSARNTIAEIQNKTLGINDDFTEALSAYIDNELCDADAVRMRKTTITNPVVRKKLENMYKIRQEIHSHFAKTKNECKTDYSKDIIKILSGEKSTNSFNKLVWAFSAMLTVVLSGFIVMLYL